jgi:hypothetical protein
VRISATMIGVGGWIDLLGRHLPIATGAGLGVAAGFLTFDAETFSQSVRALDGTIAYALPYARWALTWRALPPFGLRADVLAGITAPRPVIHAEGRAVDAIVGRPLLAFGLGVEMTLP